MHLCSDYASRLHISTGGMAENNLNKHQRQQKILSLIRAKPVGTQEGLRSLLETSGVPATQSSVSRDLEELGIVKHRGFYRLPQAPDGASSRGLLSLVPAGA